MLLTLNQVISQITTLAAAHSQIAASGVGDFAEWQAEERNYPLLWVFHETTNVGNRELVYSIRLICADRVITGEEGEDTDGMEQEVLSDTLLILLDFLAYFQQQHSQTYTVVPSATIDPFTERFNDRVAGNSMVIQIRQPFTWDACQIPQSGATIPPTVDGLTLYDFCDQSVIDRLTADQVTCLQAELCTPCQPVTQQVNGTTIGTTVSGGTNNQLIRNTAGTAVGTSANPSVIANTTLRNSATPTWTDSVVSGVTKTLAQGKALDSDGATTLLANYIPTTDGFMFTCTPSPPCADATVTINGASLGATGTIPSGGSEDIDVLQGGVATGSWNGSAWIIPTCPVAPSLTVAVSDDTPNFGDTITITATPTNITPTSYTFSLPDQFGEFVNVTQAGNTLNWVVNNFGTGMICVKAATISESAYGEVTVVTTVNIPLASAKAAFDTFKTVSAYAGAAVNVRRTDTSTTSDVGFTSGILDVAALNTFKGISAAVLTTMYNQVGNGNIVQATANIQPPIIVTGDEMFLQGLVAVAYRYSLTMTSGLALNETSTEYFVVKINNNMTANQRMLTDPSLKRTTVCGFAGTNLLSVYDESTANAVRTTNANSFFNKMLITIQYKNGAPVIAINGVVQALTVVSGTIAAFVAGAITTRYFFNDNSAAFSIGNNQMYAYYMDAADRSTAVESFLMKLHGIS